MEDDDAAAAQDGKGEAPPPPKLPDPELPGADPPPRSRLNPELPGGSRVAGPRRQPGGAAAMAMGRRRPGAGVPQRNSLPGSGGGGGRGGGGSLQTPSPAAPYLVAEMDADFERSTMQNNPSFFHRRSFQSSGLSRSIRVDDDILAGPGPGPARLERRYSVNDRVMCGSRPSDYKANCRWGRGQSQSDDEDDGGGDSPITVFSPVSHGYGNAPAVEECSGSGWQERLSSLQDRARIFFAVLFWMSLFFWGSVRDGGNNSGGMKRQRFRKKSK